MSRLALLPLHTAALMLLSASGGEANAAEPARMNGWIMNNLPAAQAEARATGKPIFVTFRCER